MAKNNNIHLGIIMLLMATLAWGGQFAVAKPILAVIDPFYMTLIRYSIAVPLFMVMLLYFEGKNAFKFEGRSGELFFLGTLGFAGFNLLAFNGLTHASPEHGAVILALMPMITFLLTWMMKGLRPNLFTFAAILSAFFGVFLVITGGHPVHAFSGGEAKWDLLFLLGAFFWVCYTMGAQRFPSWSPLRYTVISCYLGTLSIGLITLVLTFNGTLHAPSINNIALVHWRLTYMILAAALLAVLSWNVGIKLLGAVNGVLFINFVPITAFAIGVAQGRSFSAAELIGATLVIGALIANNLYLRYK
jgi:drug/metabolite transporter (DMT)-like permease